MRNRYLSLFLLFFLEIGGLQAAPLNYTFDGYIDSFGSDPAGEAASAGLGFLSLVSYTVQLDFDATGTRTYPDGTIQSYVDTTGSFFGDSYSTDYFYAIFVSGHTLLSPYVKTVSDYIDHNLGTSVRWSSGTASGEISIADQLVLQHQGIAVQDWVIGQGITGIYSYGDETAGTFSTFRTNLTLTGITPVPVPAAAWLFGSGLLVMVGGARRKIDKQQIKNSQIRNAVMRFFKDVIFL